MTKSRAIIVTADDLGLTPEINAGIIQAFKSGIVRSASLLMNGCAKQEALDLAKQNPGLEIGLHLSIVEGYSLLKRPSSITDPQQYFPGGPCLHRNWQHFIPQYLRGKINADELYEEFSLQIEAFLEHFSEIPFLNGTQHLHLLPNIQQMLIKLSAKYPIRAIRIPLASWQKVSLFNPRALPTKVLFRLGQTFKTRLPRSIASTENFEGFTVSGHLNEDYLGQTLEHLNSGTTEIMSHPGFECQMLRQALPGYKSFNWQSELAALTSTRIKSQLQTMNIELIQFKDLHLAAH